MFLEKRKYKWAAFQLHQAAEHAYKSLLLVFAGDNPNEHYLGVLGDMAAGYAPDLAGVIPKETKEEKKLFNLLDDAYIRARYDPTYKITKEQLEQLAKYIRKLHRLTKKLCTKKIESFV